MKTYRHLYPRIWDFENLYLAYRKARRGKRGKTPAADFEQVQEDELLALQNELRTRTYQPGPYHSFYIHEPKRRLISAAPFRDRVVHHALCRVIEPIWERRFIYDSYANRIGKGTHRALDRCQQFSRRYDYVLQCDVRKFFPSIDHAILQAELGRLIADDDTLWLIDKIIASGVGVLSESYQMVYFPGDDLFAANRPRGLPIGNLTSQFWANVYLNRFDHFVKRELKCRAYLRFVDDFLLFSDSKPTLWAWKSAIIEKMAHLRLTIHEQRAQVFPTETDIPFLGFRVYPTHRRVKRRKVIHFRRKLKRMLQAYEQGELPLEKLDASIQGWINHVRYGDTLGLRQSVLSFSLPQQQAQV
jgi:retron-type reverse transcriptase